MRRWRTLTAIGALSLAAGGVHLHLQWRALVRQVVADIEEHANTGRAR